MSGPTPQANNQSTDDDYQALVMSTIIANKSMLGERIRARRIEEKRQALAKQPYPPEIARKMFAAAKDHLEHDPMSFSLGELIDEMLSYLDECKQNGQDPKAVLADMLEQGRAWAER